MAERERRLKGSSERAVTFGGRRRLTKQDGKIATLANLKSQKGVVIPEVKKVQLKRRKNDKGVHRTSIIYPSEMARSDWCPRATYFRMSGYPEPESSTSFTLENVFAEGNAIHSKWQSWLSDTGLLWGDWRCSRCSEYVRDSLRPDDRSFGSCVGVTKVKFTDFKTSLGIFPEGDALIGLPHDWVYKEVTLKSTTLPISGHADGALTEHNCLIEIKSLGVGTLKFEAPQLLQTHTYEVSGKKIIDIDGIWRDFHKPLLPHVKQGNIYLWMAEQMDLPFDSIVFLYEFKANQQAKEFRITKSDDILAPMLEMSELIKTAVEIKKPPSCYVTGGCSSCRPYDKAVKEKMKEEDIEAAIEEATWD